ncbi:Predicted arabinose efflux permease, MFS family [Micromonospora pattaloongensis]|uniref:Predicted arabinose efflux permease, MFS family n=1 Tax=Micromonospora pattaloongensis TaxID=405436 RepID=A0A1H3PVA3_9ACTN|nr:MFS transporter [Micromonospora pattaloongensis]SDZ04775.1 Predicted arabinose efflux permease, MFS family [Micromonospora pattaloongensis]
MGRQDEPNRGAIYATTLVAFLAIAGIAVVDPILPVIGDAIGVSAWQVELLFTAYIAVMAVGMIPATLASGRFGFKPVLVTGVAVVGAAAILASFSNDIVQLSVLRGVWGLGNAMFFATAMVVLVALATDREWVVGLFETALGLGFAVGPLIGGLLGRLTWRLPFFVCGVFMVLALAVAARRLREPATKQPPVTVAAIFGTYRRPAFVALCAVTAAYNFVFFVILGYTPLFLRLDVVPLGLAFTGWGLGLAAGILVIGHRLAHRIGAVQTVGIAVAGLLGCLALFATSTGLTESLIALLLAGLCMGLANANLTDLALGLGSPDRRVATGAFNLVRWGAAAPAPIISGKLAEHSDTLPFWAGAAVLSAGALVYLACAHLMAAGYGERVLWSRWNRRARAAERTPEEAVGEAY